MGRSGSDNDRSFPSRFTGLAGQTWCSFCQGEVGMLTVERAAETVGVSRRTIYRWARRGTIHVMKVPSGRLRICQNSLVGWRELPGEKRALSPDDVRIKQAMDLIEERYHDPELTLESLCRQVGLSVSHLSRLFKKETGRSFRRYVMRVRIEKAARLLRESSLSMKQIAAAVGYKHVADFDHYFKMVYGLTPGAYRRLRGQKQAAPKFSHKKQSASDKRPVSRF